jgi:hypothetical protein
MFEEFADRNPERDLQREINPQSCQHVFTLEGLPLSLWWLIPVVLIVAIVIVWFTLSWITRDMKD